MTPGRVHEVVRTTLEKMAGRRPLRPRRRRLLPLRHAARLERAALREDAGRQRAPGRPVPRGGGARRRGPTPATEAASDAHAAPRLRGLYRDTGGGHDRLPSRDAVARRPAGLRRQPGRRRALLLPRRRRARRAAASRSWTPPCTSTGTRWRRGLCCARRPCSSAPSSRRTPWSSSASSGSTVAATAHGALPHGGRRARPRRAAARRPGDDGGGPARRLRGHGRAALAGGRAGARRLGRSSTCAPPTAACTTAWRSPAPAPGCWRVRSPCSTRTPSWPRCCCASRRTPATPTWRDQARDILTAWATHYEEFGVAAAPYGQALLRYLERPGPHRRRRGPRRRSGAAPARRRAARRRGRCARCSSSTRTTRPTRSAWPRRASAAPRAAGRLRVPRRHLPGARSPTPTSSAGRSPECRAGRRPCDPSAAKNRRRRDAHVLPSSSGARTATRSARR